MSPLSKYLMSNFYDLELRGFKVIWGFEFNVVCLTVIEIFDIKSIDSMDSTAVACMVIGGKLRPVDRSTRLCD